MVVTMSVLITGARRIFCFGGGGGWLIFNSGVFSS